MQIFLVVSALIFWTDTANAETLDQCQTYYRQRHMVAESVNAVTCYKTVANDALTAGNPSLYKEASEGYFFSAAYFLTHFSDQVMDSFYRGSPRSGQVRPRSLINEGIARTERFAREVAALDPPQPPADVTANPMPSGIAAYWKAVFKSFLFTTNLGYSILANSMGELRPGVLMPDPFHGIQLITSGLAELTPLLRTAQRRAPAYHNYGPARAEGLMHLFTPEEFRPGSRRRATEKLREAYIGSPRFSLNILFYARSLHSYSDGTSADQTRQSRAIQLLREFLRDAEANITLFGADRVRETQEDMREARESLESYL